MLLQIYRVLGTVALVVFAYAQYQGWSPFDNVANSHHSSASSGRSYHK